MEEAVPSQGMPTEEEPFTDLEIRRLSSEPEEFTSFQESVKEPKTEESLSPLYAEPTPLEGEKSTSQVIPLTSLRKQNLGGESADKEEEEGEEEDYSEEKKAIMWDLLREKRSQLRSKINQINILHQQIADLDKPAAQDIAVLRRKIDSCFRQIWSLQQSREESEAAINKSRAVQEQLQGQRTALNEKKKMAIFEFESEHLQKLKEIEEEIRAMSG